MRHNAHNFFILSLVSLKLFIVSVTFFLGHPVSVHGQMLCTPYVLIHSGGIKRLNKRFTVICLRRSSQKYSCSSLWSITLSSQEMNGLLSVKYNFTRNGSSSSGISSRKMTSMLSIRRSLTWSRAMRNFMRNQLSRMASLLTTTTVLKLFSTTWRTASM